MFVFRWSGGWSPSPKTHFMIALCLTLISLFLSIALFFSAYQSLKAGTVVDGVVIRSISGGEGFHTPIIEYFNSRGDSKRFRSKLASRPQRYFEGDKVKVIIPDSGGPPKLKNFITVYGLPAFAGVFSCICFMGQLLYTLPG